MTLTASKLPRRVVPGLERVLETALALEQVLVPGQAQALVLALGQVPALVLGPVPELVRHIRRPTSRPTGYQQRSMKLFSFSFVPPLTEWSFNL